MADIVLVLILLIFAAAGCRKGLVRSAINLANSVASLAMSFIVYPLLNTVLKYTPLYSMIYDNTLKKVQHIDFGKGLQSQQGAITGNITWLPGLITQQLRDNNNSAMYELLGVTTLQEYIAAYVTRMLISLLAILITWFVIKILLAKGLKMLGMAVEHLPVISTFNHGGGLMFGIIKGILIVSAIGLLIPFFIDQPLIQMVDQQIRESILARWLYDNNLILYIYNHYLS